MAKVYLNDSQDKPRLADDMWDVEEFCGYLLSQTNDLENPQKLDLHQDMTRPLAQYWINSSHNTYLTSGQVRNYISFSQVKALLSKGWS